LARGIFGRWEASLCAASNKIESDLPDGSALQVAGPEREKFNEEIFCSYLDAFLMDAEQYEFLRSERSLKNPIVDYVLTEPIVIERSPPVSSQSEGAHYNDDLPVWIGTYMGVSYPAAQCIGCGRALAKPIIVVHRN
jgi:hypothetical protein